MRIIVIGATGTIGGAVADALAVGHDVVRASRRGPVQVDMDDPASIDSLFAATPDVDAVVCCAASGRLTRLDDPSDERFLCGLQGKLLGQVHLVRRAIGHLRDGGSITLTNGTSRVSAPGMAFGALVNAGLAGFVAAAAPEMPRQIRVNSVSPGWVSETLVRMGLPGSGGVPVCDVARAYVDLVEGKAQGQVVEPAGAPSA
ncbi:MULTISPECIES: short chain dehydrogenase [unclassified Streptomyces]|uniref:short chain dehydrogenase n=1 Tax=unclassified Streptomyces TaxID=2593676 RepID=UPI0037F56E2B